MRECEAAHEYRARGGRPLRILGWVIRQSLPRQLAGAGCHLREALWAARFNYRRLPQAGEREAVAVGLLEAREAIVGASGS